MRDDRYHYEDNTIKAAKELGYGDEVIAKLKAVKTEAERQRIMVNARKEKFKDY